MIFDLSIIDVLLYHFSHISNSESFERKVEHLLFIDSSIKAQIFSLSFINKMSIHLYISVALLISTFISNVNSQNGLQQYVIRKDFFRGLKADEFTVYDPQEKHVHCRIESEYGMLQNIKVIAYPSKQEIGRLKAKINFVTYKAEISIFDRESNRWVNGSIQEIFKWAGALYNIEWNGNRITMEEEFSSLTTIFRDSVGKQMLAQFRLRPASMFWAHKYDMQIFSNKYPKRIYLLGLVANERPRKGGKR